MFSNPAMMMPQPALLVARLDACAWLLPIHAAKKANWAIRHRRISRI
jgi:hypothetical protein